MRALTLVADRHIELKDIAPPPSPAAGEVQIAVKAVALNHIDLWGFRGMAFAKRQLPLVVGAEASGEISDVGAGVTAFKAGDKVVIPSTSTTSSSTSGNNTFGTGTLGGGMGGLGGGAGSFFTNGGPGGR